MSFSKAKLKRFNDIEICDSPSAASALFAANPERKEQIEKFLKENVKPTTSTATVSKEKEGKSTTSKLKGLRLFRTPSLPHRLRFRQHSDVTSSSSAPIAKPEVQPSKAASNTPLKGKEALHYEIRQKTELLETYVSQIDQLKQKLEATEAKLTAANDDLNATVERLEAGVRSASECEAALHEKITILESEMKILIETNNRDLSRVQNANTDIETRNQQLQKTIATSLQENSSLKLEVERLTDTLAALQHSLDTAEATNRENLLTLDALRMTNDSIEGNLQCLRQQIEEDALNYVAETANLKSEVDALRQQVGEKSQLVAALNEEVLEKNIEIDSFQDAVREHYLEKVKSEELERKFQQLETELDAFWKGEMSKCQQHASSERVQIELEIRDMKVLLENANDLIRERDDKLSKCEEQVRNGIDYYVQLSQSLEAQIAELKQECSRTMTEKYNYQLTLNNTRSTVNILMERLKKSDSDVELLKSELEAVNNSRSELERKYTLAESDLMQLRTSLLENETALNALLNSSKVLQSEMNERETIFSNLLTSEEETIEKVSQITSLFQIRMDANIEKYIDMYAELKRKHDSRETYINEMKHALDEFARVIDFAQIELDAKEQVLVVLRQENDTLKLDNISLKSKCDEEKKMKAECDQWLMNGGDKATTRTPTRKSSVLTPMKAATTTPRSPKTPRSMKKINFAAGKENIVPTPEMVRSPQNVLKPRNY